MQFINALSLAPDVKDWLSNSRQPHILHVFDQACNLINERREVLSIVTTQVGNGPFNLVLEDEVLFSEHLNVESTASIFGNQLILGDLTINTANAKLWNPRPDWEILHDRRESILQQVTQLQIITTYKGDGLDTPFAKSTQGYSTIVSHPLVSTLSTALAHADISTAKAVASQLAGLGQGLTPAGDDFMMGAIYAAWIIHQADVASVLTEAIANTTSPLTTSLSATWLRSAGKGEAGILWHDFFAACVGRIGNPTYESAVQQSIDKILAVGETSGADALAGFIG